MSNDGSIFPAPHGSNVGPYMNVWGDQHRSYGTDLARFRIFLSGAYNAMGLIGPEYNGIVVLDEKQKAVLADKLFCNQGGHGWIYGQGPDQERINILEMVATCSDEKFYEVICNSGQARYDIEPPI